MEDSVSSRLESAVRGFAFLIAAMLATGLALNGIYQPNRNHAESVFRPAIESGFWKLLAAFHYWGAASLIIFGAAIAVGLFVNGFQGRARQLWLPILACTGACLLLQILGTALPMERHDVQTVNVESSIAARVPIVGPAASRFLLGGDAFSESTIAHWYRLSLVGVVGLTAAWVWLLFVARRSRLTRKDLVDGALLSVGIAIPTLLALFVPRAAGDLYLPIDAESQSASPGWYVMPMHSMLHALDSVSPNLGWIGVALVPALVGIAAISAPLWARNWSAAARRNVVLGAMAATGLLIGFYGSSPAPISGDQPVYELVDRRKGGPIDPNLASLGRAVFNKMCFGCHGNDGVGGSGGPKLTNVHLKTTDPQWFMEFVRNPAGVKPGSTMPAFPQLSEQDLKALAEWLRGEKG